MGVEKIKIMYSSVLQEMRFYNTQKTASGSEVYILFAGSKVLHKYIEEKKGGLILQDLNPA